MARTKTKRAIHWLTFLLTILLSNVAVGQSRLDTLLGKLDPQKYAASIASKSKKIEQKLVDKSVKMLERLQRQEEKIYRELLSSKDSLAARCKLGESKAKYAALTDKLKNPSLSFSVKQYIPQLDSLGTSLKFLDQNGVGGKVKDALAKTTSLQNKFSQAEEIKKFIRDRKEQLEQQLEKLGIVKQLRKINKQVYYYSAQITEYREIFKEPKKVEKKALELLSNTKLFKDFMRKNSMLASLFRLPGDQDDPATMISLSGLQTRTQINALIQQQISTGGPNAQQQFQQNMQAAQSQMNELKKKLMHFGGSSSNDELPDFKPNTQKTKSFLKRFDYEATIQSQKANNFFPITSDIGLSFGYKLNDKSIIGIGASYKLGWGRGWNNISLSHQGVGIRSYIDVKLKGSFWISGGYEQNYRTAFRDFAVLRDMSGWQRSGLIGLSKVIPVKTKFFKKTNMKLLWDFLSYEQVPRAQPIVFRIGYSFK